MFRLVVLVALASGARSQLRIVPRLDGRIVGGQAVNIKDYPYQVSIEYYDRYLCGGSIIGPNKFLTAAHCTSRRSTMYTTIRHSSTFIESEGIKIHVSRIVEHPKYNPSDLSNDVSVLISHEDIKESNVAKVIRVIEADAVEGNRKAVCTGWGALSSGGLSPIELQAVEVEEVDRLECNNRYNGGITDTMICFASPGKDSCNGDSGSPLVVDGKQVGIVSWGFWCAHLEFPGVYSHVAALRTFIDLYV